MVTQQRANYLLDLLEETRKAWAQSQAEADKLEVEVENIRLQLFLHSLEQQYGVEDPKRTTEWERTAKYSAEARARDASLEQRRAYRLANEHAMIVAEVELEAKLFSD